MSPITSKTTTVSVPLIRQQLDQLEITTAAKDIIMASWTSGTLKQYKTFINRWLIFCHKFNINPTQASIPQGINFLAALVNEGLGYSAVNTARSALSAVLPVQGGITFGEHPSVSRLLKGVFNIKPSLPKYSHIWDVSSVLNYLRGLSPNTELLLKDLTLKLTMLLALLTGQRCQTIYHLDLNSMQILPDRYIFVINKKLKHTKPGNHLEPITLMAYHDKSLCIVDVLKEYIFRTSTLRHGQSKLLISYIKPNNPVSKDTVSRWVKDTLKLAGIDTCVFSAHSTRSASTSCSLKEGLSLATILKAGGWSNAMTFARYYNKPLDMDNNFGSVVLSSVYSHQT